MALSNRGSISPVASEPPATPRRLAENVVGSTVSAALVAAASWLYARSLPTAPWYGFLGFGFVAGGLTGWFAARRVGSNVRLHFTRAASYRAAKDAIDISNPLPEDRELDIVSVRDGRADDDPLPEALAFAEALAKKKAAADWKVRLFLLVTSQAGLDHVIKKELDLYPGVHSFEVKVLATNRLGPRILPLLVGRTTAFLGIGQTYGRNVDACVEIKGRPFATVLGRYFDVLWAQDVAVTIRDGHGKVDRAVEAVRIQLKLLDN